MSEDNKTYSQEVQDRIRELAHSMWEWAGRQQNMALEYWVAAEKEVLAAMRTAAERLMPEEKSETSASAEEPKADAAAAAAAEAPESAVAAAVPAAEPEETEPAKTEPAKQTKRKTRK